MKAFLLKNIPEPLFKQFKATCAMKGITMREALLTLIAQFSK